MKIDEARYEKTITKQEQEQNNTRIRTLNIITPVFRKRKRITSKQTLKPRTLIKELTDTSIFNDLLWQRIEYTEYIQNK